MNESLEVCDEGGERFLVDAATVRSMANLPGTVREGTRGPVERPEAADCGQGNLENRRRIDDGDIALIAAAVNEVRRAGSGLSR